MDQENNSSASSFEDLTHLNENELKEAKEQGLVTPTEGGDTAAAEEGSSNSSFMDVLGNGQLTKQILKAGEEDSRPMHMDWCKVSFVGKLDDGTVVEDVQNMEMHLGDNEVVQGLDMAIALMNLGETAEIKVNARFAYGELGLKNETDNTVVVPPNATVTYHVELHEFKPVDPEEARSFHERNTVGTRKKERGNYWFKRNEFNLAIQLYRKAIEYFDENVDSPEAPPSTAQPLTSEEIKELLEQRMVVYNNLAAAQMKIDALDAAMKSVETVLMCQPDNVKALYRKGKILDAKGATEEAILIFQKAATLDPENKSFQVELAKLILKRKREQRNERNLYQKMLGQAQKMEQKKPPTTPVKQPPTETSQWKWFYLLGSILVGVAGVALYRYKYE